MPRAGVSLSLSPSGIRQVDDRLLGFAVKDARKIQRSAVTAGLRVIAKAVKLEAPVGKTRRIKKAVGWRFKKFKRSGYLMAKVGSGVGKKKAQAKEVFYAASVAQGTPPRFRRPNEKFKRHQDPNTGEWKARRRKGARATDKDNPTLATGKLGPNPFVRRGYQRSKDSALSTMAQKTKEGIRKLR